MKFDWTQLSRSQRSLIAELAVSLATKLGTYDSFGVPEGYFYDEGNSDFEDAAELLIDLSLSAGDEVPHTNLHRFLETSKIRNIVLNSNATTGPALNHALAVYINFFASYCTKELRIPTGQRPFAVDNRYDRVMEALAQNGYILNAGRSFSWTGKIAPVMYALGFWQRPTLKTELVHPESTAFIINVDTSWKTTFRKHALLLTDVEFLTYLNNTYGFEERLRSKLSQHEIMTVLREVHLHYRNC